MKLPKLKKIKSGIYCIRNLINNKVYIGSSVNIPNRFYSHRNRLKRNSHFNQHLQRSWNKYGNENFEFIILEITSDLEKLVNLEQQYINKYPFDATYNMIDANRVLSKSNIKKKYWRLTIRLTNEEKEILKRLAEEEGLSMTQFVKDRVFSNTDSVKDHVLYIREALDDLKKYVVR